MLKIDSITSHLSVSQDLTGTRQPICSAALKINRSAGRVLRLLHGAQPHIEPV
jgi:hypothetical protein